MSKARTSYLLRSSVSMIDPEKSCVLSSTMNLSYCESSKANRGQVSATKEYTSITAYVGLYLRNRASAFREGRETFRCCKRFVS